MSMKSLAYWESNQYYLRIFRPSALFVVFKHVTLTIAIGTITLWGPVSISCNISSFWKFMFTNLILHLCQSDCLCRCQMYSFNAFYVTYGGNYKRHPSVFDLRAYSTGVSLSVSQTQWLSMTYVHLAIFLMFSHGKMSITLLLHKHVFKRSNIYLLSSTGKRWKTISGHFVRVLLQLGAVQHWQWGTTITNPTEGVLTQLGSLPVFYVFMTCVKCGTVLQTFCGTLV